MYIKIYYKFFLEINLKGRVLIVINFVVFCRYLNIYCLFYILNGICYVNLGVWLGGRVLMGEW